MLSWGSILATVLATAFVVVIVAQFLPKRYLGKRYFKKLLWEYGIDSRSLSETCIQEFVEDAYKYAALVSAVPPSQATSKVYFNLEFERMLRIHAFVAAALISGKKKSEIWDFENKRIEKAIEVALLSGKKNVTRLANRKIGESITHQAIEAATLRKHAEIFESVGRNKSRFSSQLFEAAFASLAAPSAEDARVRSGDEWEAQESILRRHRVLH